jgi:hypothetical protein
MTKSSPGTYSATAANAELVCTFTVLEKEVNLS